MEILNLSIEFHIPDGNTLKKIVRVDNTTKIGEMSRLLLSKFGRSDFDPSQFQLIVPQKATTISFHVLSDLNKSLASYNIKNNDELLFKKRQKKSNPSNAKLSKKKPESIFKTLFSMSTLEMKLGEGDKSTTSEITEVENQIDDLGLLFKALEILNNNFNQNKDDILSSFQYGELTEIADLIRIVLSNDNNNNNNNNSNNTGSSNSLNLNGSNSINNNSNNNNGNNNNTGTITVSNLGSSNNNNQNMELTINQKNPKILCNFILHLLQIIFSQTSLTYSLYTTYLKVSNSTTDSSSSSSRSTYFYDIPIKNRIILKHIMLFLNNLTQKDSNLLDSISTIIGPFILGNVLLDPPPPSNSTPPITISNSTSNTNLNNYLSTSNNGDESPDFQSINNANAAKTYNRENSGSSLNSLNNNNNNNNILSQTVPIIQPININRQHSSDFANSTGGIGTRTLSNTENSLCKKVAVDLIQNIPLYLLFSHLKIQQLEGEKILFSADNIYCVDKCNFPPNKACLGEIWVTNFRIIFINSNSSTSTIPNSTSSTSISSFSSTQNLSILSIMTLFGNSGGATTTNTVLNGGSSSSSNIPTTSNSSSSNSNTPIPTSPTFHSAGGMLTVGNISGGIPTSTSSHSNLNNTTNNNILNSNKLSTLDNTEIPLSMIYRWKMVKAGQLYESFKIYCKDFRCKIIGFPSNSSFLSKFKDLLTKCSVPTLDTIFAYNSKESIHFNTECFPDNQLLEEYNRLLGGTNWEHWRVTNISKQQQFEHYPITTVVPKSVADSIVMTSAYYRSFGFPVLAWSHPTHKSSITRAISPDDPNRGSTNYLLSPNSPNVNSNNNNNNSRSSTIDNGQSSFKNLNNNNSNNVTSPTPVNISSTSSTTTTPTLPSSSQNILSPNISTPRIHHSISSSSLPQVCQEDIDFLRAILDIKSSSMLTVFDTSNGGSYSSTMIGCQIEFLNLPPATKVKERFNRLLHLHLGNPDSEWSETIRFFWLDPLKPILSAAINIAMHVDKGRSVLIQNSIGSANSNNNNNNSTGGPDQELQLSSLSQLLLDPYYRTIDGFRVLIEKEWLSFGYPFSKRCHHKVSSDDGFSPIFMQFIFLVWQIWKEFPTHFQFNEYYLLTLLDNVYNSRFGTFLCNNYKERMENNVYSSTKSFWSFQQQNQTRFTNLFYNITTTTRHLNCQRVFQDTMWNEFFYRYCFKSSLAIEQFEDRIKLSLLDIEMTVNSAITSTASALMPFLESLDLSNLRLYYLPSESTLYHLIGLKELNLSKNNLNSISCSLSNLVKLERLSFEENSITNLPIETVILLSDKLKSLTELNLSSNQLIELPMEFERFKLSLKKLHLKNNRFHSIPEVLNKLENLIELDLSDMDLSINSLSTNVGIPCSLSKLKILNLNQTRINELPKEIGELTSLEKFYLDFNTLSHLPHSFRNLTNLEELSITFNAFTEFPREICYLINLKKLIFEGNQLQYLPNEISQLSKLNVLNLCKNKLDSLPASIGQLSQLVSLNLNSNQLISLRPTMGLLNNLNELKLDGNRLKTPPPEIITLGLKSILLYLKDLIKGQEQCYKMKLMIVGQENVGKTTLLKTLKEKKKKAATGPNISTDGIAIDQWVFSCLFEEIVDISGSESKLIKKKQDITLSIWDFAGQEIYYTTHQFFLSERSVYIVAWNCALAEEESRVEFWLQSITTRAKDAPIIIVGTHLDDVNRTTAKMQKKRMKEKYLTRYKNIKAIKLVSCTSGKGITSLREKLEALVQSQSNMGESLPRSYMLLENLVKEETKKRIIPTIPWTEFIQMGTICTIIDEAELLRATMFLHQLGSLVYFPKEPGLKQFVILDPQWITTMLSSIITTKHSYAKEGILQHKSLKQIWRPPQYPTNLHPHLISLLEKFEISYNLSSLSSTSFETGTSLIPSLLLNDRPAIFPSLWGSFNQSIRQFGRVYQFEFVPNGFFSRLMVRILNFARVEAKCYWKNGMILQQHGGEETIFLEMNNAKKSLSFTVRGGANSATLSRDVIETIQSLLDDSFQLPTFVFVPCFHCIFLSLPQCYYFPLDVCENAAVKGTGYLKCLTYDANVRTDLLVPDLVMSNFTGAKIPFDQLLMDELIGEGGAALVYRARWQGQTVAVKKLKTIENLDGPVEINDISLSKAFNEFRRECWVMSELEHPNIVQLKGLCLDPLCIVTEYLPHGNLYSFLHKPEIQEFSWLFRLKVALDISSGMAFLHSSTPPIIHRDLKSPNILLASLDENAQTIAKVVDFGLSGLQHTITNKGVENPLWLAPEILNKSKEASTQTDVYAFGVILWELLTRKDYFGDIGFMTLVEEKVINGERPSIPDDCPEIYSKLIIECWQHDASQRPKFSEIEDRLIKIAESMFPDIHLSNIYQSLSSSPSKSSNPTSPTISSSTTTIKPLNLDSIIIDNQIINSPKDNNNNDHKRKLSTDSSSSYRNKSTHDTISHSTSVASDLLDIDNTLNVAITPRNRSKSTNEDKSTTTTTTATTTASSDQPISPNSLSNHLPIQHSQSHQQLESGLNALIDALPNLNPGSPSTNNNNNNTTQIITGKKVMYTSIVGDQNRNRRGSVSLQPFQNEFNRELLPNQGTIQCLIKVGNGYQVWAGTGNGFISTWKIEGQEKYIQRLFEANKDKKRIHCLYSYMNTVWCGSADDTVTIWDIDSYQKIKSFSIEGPTCLTRVANTMWVGTIANTIHIYDLKKKTKYKGKISLDGPVECLLKKESEVWVATIGNIARIDINSLRVVQMIKAHEKAIHAMIQVDGQVWTASSDGSIKIWSSTCQLVHTISSAHSSRIFTLELVGDFVWSGSWDTTIKIWSIKDYRLVSENSGKHKDAISSFVYISNEIQPIVSNIDTIQQQQQQRPIQKQVWSGSWDSSICVWALPNDNNINTTTSSSSRSNTISYADSNLHNSIVNSNSISSNNLNYNSIGNSSGSYYGGSSNNLNSSSGSIANSPSNSSNQLGTIYEQISPPLSSTPPSGKGSITRRTVSFMNVLDRFSNQDKTKNKQ